MQSTLTYKQWCEQLVTNPKIMGGSTVFPQSRVTVQRIAGLQNRGESQEVILEDYPFLTDNDLKFAKRYISEKELCQLHTA